ncbi:Competence protein CoiA-like family protein [Terribacillus saccharophilus]|uniref:Competence protein CoiA-like family protein n=1 Tax=Terribacillus saccharophilus TaxID=361277 RepID=A0AAX2EJV1_9BACI|nr:Competence protein CoiA-like family protein [Terribacillus saccharophilus]
MREALHVLDKQLVKLPYNASDEEITTYRKLAKKETYVCPYCEALLIVRHGQKRGLHFSHLHSETCEESILIDKAEKKYTKQTERETKLHGVLIDIILDELNTKSKIYDNMHVNLGYKEKPNWAEYPDIYVKLPDKELALCVITNVSPTEDIKLAMHIKKRNSYLNEQGLETIWFIEKKEQAIEKDKNSLMLWDAELSIASKTEEDKKWTDLISRELEDKNFFKYFNYKTSFSGDIDIKSLFYIYNNPERIVVKVQHFLKDRIEKPLRSFLLGDGYELAFSDALVIDNGFKLSDSVIEEEQRTFFLKNLKQRKTEYEAQLEKMKEISRLNSPISYRELVELLKVSINLKHKEQLHLFSEIISKKVGMNNSIEVWKIVVSNDYKTYDELKRHIEKLPRGWFRNK